MKTRKAKNKPSLLTYSQLKKSSPLKGLDFDYIFCSISKKTREKIITHPETKLSKLQYKKLKVSEKKRLDNWPLAYLTKEQGFFNLNLKVSPDVLIPRPETELLVSSVSDDILQDKSKKQVIIIDIGTGSGAIILSLAKNIKNRKNIKFLASDISKPALKIAKQNAKKYKLDKKIIFKSGDLLNPWKEELKKFLKKDADIIITANLPYLKTEEMKELSILKEPRMALFSGKDGLNHYRKLFKQLSIFLNKNKKTKDTNIIIICEINPQQKEPFKEIIKKESLRIKLNFKKDLNKKNRFAFTYIK